MIPARLRAMLILLFCGVGCIKLIGQPLRAWLREELHLGAGETALIVALVMVTEAMRPVLALGIDALARRGVDPRMWGYLAAGLAIVAAFTSTTSATSATTILWIGLAVVGAVILETIAFAAIAAEQARGVSTALLGPARTFVICSVTVIASALAGWVAEAPLSRLGPIAAAIMAVALLASRALPPRAVMPAQQRLTPSRATLTAAGFAFIFYVVPGFATLLYIERHDVLGFSQWTIGGLEALNNLAAIPGLIAYRWLRSRAELTVVLPLAIGAYALSPVGYLVYSPGWVAPAVELSNGILSIFGLAAVSEALVRGAGREGAALSAAVVLGAAHLGVALSDPLGAGLKEVGLPFVGVIAIHIGCYSVVATVVSRFRGQIAWL